MKEHHKQGYRDNARATLGLLHVTEGQSFHTLSSSQVEQVLEMADRDKYRKPKNANGSRARYYYERLQRHARLKL